MSGAARLALALVVFLGVASTAGPAGGQEATRVRIALAGASAVYVPFWLAAEETLRRESVAAEVVTLSSTGAAQALAAGSADIVVSSLSTLVLAIAAGQPVVGFYAGFSHADVEWYARPEIRGWDDLRGKRMAVSALGGLTESLTSEALRRRGLESGRDVSLVVVGVGPERLHVLAAGRVDATSLAAPFKWEAAARGFTRLGTQAEEIGPEWPRVVMWTRARLLDERPDLVRAVLRGHVRAIRLVREDRPRAVATILRVLRYRPEHAERAYDEVVAGLDERGRLPSRGLAVFWRAAVDSGDVEAPWPEARFFDRRFVDSFERWAPR